MRLRVFMMILSVCCGVFAEDLPKCLFLNSYHKGYEWSDGVEKAVYENLKGVCEVQSFYLDAKKNPDKEALKAKGKAAKELIESLKPKVVIAADDNASDEVIVPYFKNSQMPVVFCGVNWSTKKHGYPFSNATGMVEVTPVKPLLQEMKRVLGKVKTAVFLAGDVEADQKNYEIFRDFYKEEGVTLKPSLVKSLNEWEEAFRKAQKADLVIIANNAGIKDWDHEKVKSFLQKNMKKPTITSHEYMVKYAVLSFTKIPEEQGEWAAQVTKDVLKGAGISSIPVMTNRRWNSYINEDLAKLSKVKIPSKVKGKSTLVQL